MKVSPKALFCSSESASSACCPAWDCVMLTPWVAYQPTKQGACLLLQPGSAGPENKEPLHCPSNHLGPHCAVLDWKLWSFQVWGAEKSPCMPFFKWRFLELWLGFMFPFISAKGEDTEWAVPRVPDEDSSTGCDLKGHYYKNCGNIR